MQLHHAHAIIIKIHPRSFVVYILLSSGFKGQCHINIGYLKH